MNERKMRRAIARMVERLPLDDQRMLAANRDKIAAMPIAEQVRLLHAIRVAASQGGK